MAADDSLTQRQGWDQAVDSMRTRGTAATRAAALAGAGLAGIFAAVAVLVSLCLVALIGFGIYLVPGSVRWLRAAADRSRRLAGQHNGAAVPSSYGRPVEPQAGESRGAHVMVLGADPALWRDMRWALYSGTIGAVFALVPVGLILFGIYGAVVQPFIWQHVDDGSGANGGTNWYAFVHVQSQPTAWLAAVVGVGMVVLGYAIARPVLDREAALEAALLGPGANAKLQQRVTHLTDTRATAVDTQAAELRRIERDLHDGAQARLVAMGMNLGAAESLLDTDPEAARAMLVDAKQASMDALDELRNLVRGIHPPVLADRGLVDAVRALALDSAIVVDVRGALPGRPDPAVESAMYFAISEVLTNAAKHARSTSVIVSIGYADGAVRVSVADDGVGGADVAHGSGLRGIQNRLATLDGTMTVVSPVGGPTFVAMEVPCALSSAKTSFS